MKKIMLVGFPDLYILKLTNFLQNNPSCERISKVYTSFQFFREYKEGSVDIIFLDAFSHDSEIVAIGKKIRELDANVFIVGMSNNSNFVIQEQFKKEISNSEYLFKTKDNQELIEKLLKGGSDEISEKQTFVAKDVKTILVVDDFANTLNVIKFTLEKAAFKVVTANSGQEALKLFSQGIQPDIIITDLNMPNMDGFELIKNIRQAYNVEGVPIFLLTTEFNFAKKLKAKELNVSGWIQKPYNSSDFIKIISKALE